MHILSISDDPILARARSQVLSVANHTVKSSSSVRAWRVLVTGDFDAVVLCASVPYTEQVHLVRRMTRHLPSLIIICCDEDGYGSTSHDRAPNVVHVPRFNPAAMLAALESRAPRPHSFGVSPVHPLGNLGYRLSPRQGT
jgi:DNA-binding NtrC family response regulator